MSATRAAGPVFFLSWAHPQEHGRASRSDRPRGEERLFDDLSDHLYELMKLAPGQDPGYMDTSMQGGEVWKQDLGRMVGRCKVFVALLSDLYLHSPWCRHEWDTYRCRPARKVRSTPHGDHCAILPVRWIPLSTAPNLPGWHEDVQEFSFRYPDDFNIPRAYQEAGLYGLLSTNRLDAFDVVVWALAMRIRDLFYAYEVEEIDDPPPLDLPPGGPEGTLPRDGGTS